MQHSTRRILGPVVRLCTVAAGAQDLSGPLRRTTEFRGTALGLDGVHGGPRNDQTELRPCGHSSGQHRVIGPAAR